MSTFGERLAKAVDESRLSQNQVAREIGATSSSRITEWKRGEGSPSVDQLVRLADVLGVSLGWLAANRGPRIPVPPEQAASRLGVVGALAEEIVRLAHDPEATELEGALGLLDALAQAEQRANGTES